MSKEIEEKLDRDAEALHRAVGHRLRETPERAALLRDFLHRWGLTDAVVEREDYQERFHVWLDESRIDDADAAIEAVEAAL